MSTIEVHLDEATIARAMQLAQSRHVSLEEVISQAVEQFANSAQDKPPPESIIGLFSDIPELMDEIVKEAYEARERTPFRANPE